MGFETQGSKYIEASTIHTHELLYERILDSLVVKLHVSILFEADHFIFNCVFFTLFLGFVLFICPKDSIAETSSALQTKMKNETRKKMMTS